MNREALVTIVNDISVLHSKFLKLFNRDSSKLSKTILIKSIPLSKKTYCLGIDLYLTESGSYISIICNDCGEYLRFHVYGSLLERLGVTDRELAIEVTKLISCDSSKRVYDKLFSDISDLDTPIEQLCVFTRGSLHTSDGYKVNEFNGEYYIGVEV